MAKRGVVIVAGGSGSRMQSALPKQFLMLGGEPIVARTINTFSEALPGAEIVVDEVTGQTYAEWEAYGATYKVWLEDETALENKLKLMKKLY